MKDSSQNSEIASNGLPYAEIKIAPPLRLRQLDVSQAERLFELTNLDRTKLQEWLPWPEHTQSVDDSKSFVELMIDRRIKGEAYGYGIELNGILMGHISLMHLKESRDVEIGYWLSSLAEGQGITTQASIALTAFAMDTLGLRRIAIRAHPENIGSNKVAEKTGYKFERLTEDEDGPLNVWVMER